MKTHLENSLTRLIQLAFVILLTIYASDSLAQFCGTETTIAESENRDYSSNISCVNESVSSNMNNGLYVPGPLTEIKTIRLVLHVMQRSDGTRNLQQNEPLHLQWLEGCASYLNWLMSTIPEEWCDGVETNSLHIEDSRIRFVTTEIQWHQDDLGWNNTSTTSSENDLALCGSYCYDHYAVDQEHVLNVYLLGSTRTIEAFDLNPLPDEGMHGCGPGYWGPNSNYLTLSGLYDNFLRYPAGTFGDFSYVGQPWVEFGMLLHEIGHCFGLHHSWYTDQEALFGLCNTEQIDMCEPIGTVNCSNNVMSYSNTKNNFTYLQLAHLHQLMSGGWRTAMLNECERDPERDVIVNSSQTWIFGKVFGGNVEVQNGATLTIKCKVNMPKEGSIIIHPGAKVILDGGVCTNSCGYYWKGFEVWGQSAERQISHEQGTLEVKNGAIIENAECGVRLGHLISTEPQWEYDWAMTGGIIKSMNYSVFKNNKKDVEFLSYQNYYISGNNHIPKKNASYFYETEFVIDKALSHVSNLSQRVSLFDVDGIVFRACNFHIDSDALTHYEIQNRGSAIYSMASSFTVKSSCSVLLPEGGECDPGYLTAETLGEPNSDVLPSRFSNYLLAIRTIGGDGFGNTSVSGSIFTNNQFGIFLKALDDASVYRNRFFIDEQNFDIPISYGISLLECNGYEISRNIFEGTGDMTEFNTGLWVSNSPPNSNEIYLNDFVGLYAGSIAQGFQAGGDFNFQGLEMLCGLYENSKYNLAINKYGTFLGQIALRQGDHAISNSDVTAPAGNLFTQTNWGNPAPYTDYFICPDGECGPLIYEHHDELSSWPVLPMQIDPLVIIESPNTAIFSTRQEACPIRHGVTHTPQHLHSSVISKRFEIDALKIELEELVDGGNTPSVLSTINNPNNSSASIRTNLISLTPYLSDAAIDGLITRQPALNPWHLCELLIACSPLNPIIFTKTKNSNQLSEFLVGLLTEYQNCSNNYVSKVSSLKQLELEKTNALSSYIRTRISEDDENYFLEDVKDIMSGEETNNEIKKKVAILRQEGNLIAANLLLEQYDEDQDTDVWKQFMTVILDIDNTGGFLNATQDHIATLETIAQSKKRGYGHAEAILEILTGIQPTEELNLPQEGLKSLKVINEIRKPSLMGVYPNPANGEFYITYVLPTERSKAFVQIYDVSGKLIRSENITNGYGIFMLNAADFERGSYFFELELNGHKVATEKFLIVD